MKKLFIFYSFLLITFFTSSCKSKDQNYNSLKGFYEIKGVASMTPDSVKVYLSNSLTSKIIDSAYIIKEKFEFKGNVAYPDLYEIYIPHNDMGTTFVLENSAIQIELYNKRNTLKGSKLERERRQWYYGNELWKKNDSKIDDLSARLRFYADTPSEKNEYSRKIDSLKKLNWAIVKDLVIRNPKSPNALSLLYFYADGQEIDESKKYYELLDSSLQSHPRALDLKRKLYKKPIQIGESAPNIASKTTKGDNFDSNTLQGKYSLLVFWASWCGPCRKEHPAINSFYEKFKGKINIVGISIDGDEAKWHDAVKKDELKWTQISDLKGNSSIAAIDFEIKAVPTNFLLDEKGNIINKNIKIEDLEKIIKPLIENVK